MVDSNMLTLAEMVAEMEQRRDLIRAQCHSEEMFDAVYVKSRHEEDVTAHQMQKVDQPPWNTLRARMELVGDRSFCCFFRDSLDNFTLLMDAMQFSSIPYMRALLELGVPVEPVDFGGSTVLHHAVGSLLHTDFTDSTEEMVKLADDRIRLIVGAGGDMTRENDEGMTPLALAVRGGGFVPPTALDTLLELNADPMSRDSMGFTLLHHAAASNNAGTMQKFLDMVCLRTPERRTFEAYTPLHCADMLTLPVLLSNGANMNAVNRKNHTALPLILAKYPRRPKGHQSASTNRLARADINKTWTDEELRRWYTQLSDFMPHPIKRNVERL